MQRENNRFVIGRENNVVRVDFSRDPEPPAPRFPGASGLREIGDESTSATKNVSAVAWRAALSNFSRSQRHVLLGLRRMPRHTIGLVISRRLATQIFTDGDAVLKAD